MKFSRRSIVAAAAVCSLSVVACSGSDGEATPETTIAATTTTVDPPDVSDGRLSIGVLLPVDDTLIGQPMIDAATEAISRINEAGGVLGRTVRPVVADEGTTTTSAAAAIQTLLAQNVDAIVGPSSSIIALSTLDDIVGSGTLACSPTASALALDDFPDDELFFRTVPSDSLQALAISDVADQTGAQRAAIAYIDDAYGRPLSDAVNDSLALGPVSVVGTFPFTDRDEDLQQMAQDLLDTDAQVAIVLADGTDGVRFLEALDAVDASGLTTVIVNDPMRNPDSPQRIAALSPMLRQRIVGVAPQAEPSAATDSTDDPAPTGLFAANAFDCVNLIALAAVKAGSDAPSDIAGQMPTVSSGGSICRSFTECVDELEGDLEIDYAGPSGVTDLISRRGDPSRAVFDLFSFDADGQDELRRTFIAGT